MGPKKTKADNFPLEDTIKIKYVAASNMWCKTVFSKGKQVQTWHVEKPQ